ncbi:lysine exporter LysO family protein [Vibrio sp. SS-MA-C1-2]|uniref:lysine exporter LysO family protein n=1 Tax=Vibrio sp. SS-MA-C1-2 TaxID=2908646 RepID=UPI001F3BFE64|nr:lysine exporter LysO family protein [Vibrio sp. SS-MA-C1-2]UJF20001.1 lysine exporter LysO family protein [Vibrio sp. SS-MA-C1-2]
MYTGMLYIFLPLIIGYLIPIKQKNHLEQINSLTSRLVFIILGLMGLSLASLDNLTENLNQILTYTLVFFSCITLANFATLPLIDKIMPMDTEQHHKQLPILTMVMESLKLMFVVIGGLFIGLFIPDHLGWVDAASEMVLLILLFLIGIQLRNSGMTLKQIILNKHGLAIAVVIILSSWIGGLVAAKFLSIPYNHGLAMASGFGWYSLAGILMGDGLGPIYGGASFMNELLRELVAIVVIPLLIRRYPHTAIGYGGATAMDFTLPVIQNSGGVRCIPVAIVSGFLLSLLVPVFILFFLSL